ncbi:flagellar hook-associated protein 3 FlgL [Modestobacter sp. DSM 44400]|uniref:flagellin N-terminal helical domain-containing protein n=1 Tax=Modestobacter sp. DSM 44400 TaxID=1550230 RepID=UPI00089AAB6F|nr:flagellin [Modestobacter sp. DSM 44400]SDX88018.1 flagellar hook-associated protein 3 FlgL [Modestobacter sp. DSM 44400]
MRITQRAITTTSLQGLNSNLAAVNKIQQQLTSGTTISRPSDSPTGTNTSLLTRRDMAGVDQQARNITDGVTVLNSTDSTLQDMLDQVLVVRNLTLQALNQGTMSAESQQAIAAQVSGLRESLLGAANTVVQGRPLFGGVTTGRAAYASDGTYTGLGGSGGIPVVPVNRRISDVESVRVDITGAEAFGDPVAGKDLFAVVANIVANVGDVAALRSDLADLDVVRGKMLTATADIGTRQARFDTAKEVNTNRSLILQAQLSANEDVDMPRTIMELQMQQTGYQAALQATAQVIQPTLLDFLR